MRRKNEFSIGMVLTMILMVTLFSSALFKSIDEVEPYKIKARNVSIETFFERHLGYSVNAPSIYAVPPEIRNNLIFEAVLITKERFTFSEIEKKYPGSIVLFPADCREFYIFTGPKGKST